jgi:hypothetical protein
MLNIEKYRKLEKIYEKHFNNQYQQQEKINKYYKNLRNENENDPHMLGKLQLQNERSILSQTEIQKLQV